MATLVQNPRMAASYQTAPLEIYSGTHQTLSRRLYERVAGIVGSNRAQEYKGSYSVFASTSEATAGKIIIYESGKGKTNGDWPDLQDGVYALMRANAPPLSRARICFEPSQPMFRRVWLSLSS